MTRAEAIFNLRELRASRPYLKPRWLKAIDEAVVELEAAEAADRTRPDYNIRCDECGRAHIIDTSLPSKIWNQIAEPHNALCTVCIDNRLAAKGLTAEAEFYYVGAALRSKMYTHDHHSAEALEEAEKVIGEQIGHTTIAMRSAGFTDQPIDHLTARARAWRDKYGKQGGASNDER